MQYQLAIATFAALIAAAPDAGRAADGRPRGGTIQVVAPGAPAASGTTLNIVSSERDQPEEPLPLATARERAGQLPDNQAKVEFLVPDQTMGAWIKPAGPAAKTPPMRSDRPAVRVANRRNTGTNSIVVMGSEEKPRQSVPESAVADAAPSAPQAPPLAPTQRRAVDPSTVFAEPVSKSPSPTIGPPPVAGIFNASRFVESDRPAMDRVTSEPMPSAAVRVVEKQEIRRAVIAPPISIAAGSRDVARSVPAQGGPEQTAATATATEEVPPTQPIESRSVSRVVARLLPAPPPPVTEPSRSEPPAPIAVQPKPREPKVQVAAPSTPPHSPAVPPPYEPRIVYRAPDVAPMSNRGYHVPQTPSLPFGGHGRQSDLNSTRTARANGYPRM